MVNSKKLIPQNEGPFVVIENKHSGNQVKLRHVKHGYEEMANVRQLARYNKANDLSKPLEKPPALESITPEPPVVEEDPQPINELDKVLRELKNQQSNFKAQRHWSTQTTLKKAKTALNRIRRAQKRAEKKKRFSFLKRETGCSSIYILVSLFT